jgi:hypothetical protein
MRSASGEEIRGEILESSGECDLIWIQPTAASEWTYATPSEEELALAHRVLTRAARMRVRPHKVCGGRNTVRRRG